MRKILVAVDGSDHSRKAAAFAARLARDTSAQLLLVHIYDIHAAAGLGMVALTKEQMNELKHRKSRASFRAADDAIGDTTRLEIERVAEMGDPAMTIVAVAKQANVDLIVMGSRGLSPVKELLVGSVSDRVMRHASCPVTIVR